MLDSAGSFLRQVRQLPNAPSGITLSKKDLFEKKKKKKKKKKNINNKKKNFFKIRRQRNFFFKKKKTKKSPIIIWNGFEKNKRSMISSLKTL
jgi:hypothetical protein